MTQALYRRWRSQTFDEVVGQEHVIRTLRNALRDDRVAHAYLFAGPRGTGKTSTARILAKALNCNAAPEARPCNRCPTCIAINEGRMIDLIEIDAASNNSVDNIRELRDKVGFLPTEGRFKIYIIDEVHMLTNSAFNALLKTLEEPPPHTRFVLATTEPHKIPATVLSRCQRFDFRRIPAVEIAEHLRHIVTAEGYEAEEEALLAIARSAQGCMRDAVSLLDQMLSFGGRVVTLAQVQQSLGAVTAQAVNEFVEALATREIPRGLRLIQQLVLEGSSLTEFTHQVIEHLRGILVLQMAQDPSLLRELPAESVQQMQAQAQRLTLERTLYAIKRFGEAGIQLKNSYQPQLPLELALIEVVQGEAFVPAAGMVAAPAQPAAQPVATASPAAPAPLPPATARAAAAGEKAVPDKTGRPKPGATKPDTPQPGEAPPPPLDKAAVQRLRSQWKSFQAQVKSQLGMKVWAALNSVKDVAVSDHAVAFAFGNNAFAQQMLAETENQTKVAAILGELLGRPVQLECRLGDQARVSGSRSAVSEESVRDDDADQLVAYAVEQLGALVVE